MYAISLPFSHTFRTSELTTPRTTYTDPSNTTRTWEHAERPTRPADSDIDGVGIVAILKNKGSEAEIVLQKQYRPPLGKVVIEVPAGLVDEGESAEEAAVRELREETGYVGVVGRSSGVMFNGIPPFSFSFSFSFRNGGKRSTREKNKHKGKENRRGRTEG